jgi:hypothetical protein
MLYGELPEVKLNGSEPLRGILVKIRNPPKTAVLRLPTTQEMLARLGQVKLLRTLQGTRAPKLEWAIDPATTRTFFETLRLDKGPEFDEDEIAKAVVKLTYCQVTDCEVGDEYRISLATSMGDTVHILGDPTMADLAACRRKIVSTRSLGHGREESRYPPEPVVGLYDKVAQSIEGYANSYTAKDVPPDHKYAVAMALMNKLDEVDAVDPNS